MRRLRLIVILLIALGLIGGGGVAVEAVWHNRQLSRQQADYDAGLKAAQQADCSRALRLLTSARKGGSTTVEAAADRARPGCEELLRAQSSATSARAPADAIGVWIRYLNSEPAPAFQTVARKAAQTLLNSRPLTAIVTSALCWQRSIMREDLILPYHDPQALDFLSACLSTMTESRDPSAINVYSTLRTEFPRAAENHQNVVLLGRLLTRKLTFNGMAAGAHFPIDHHPTLHGRTRLVLISTSRTNLKMIFAGGSTRLVRLPPCKSCSVPKNKAAAMRQCVRRGVKKTITLPPDRYVWSEIGTFDFKHGFSVERWTLKPNSQYAVCWWDAR